MARNENNMNLILETQKPKSKWLPKIFKLLSSIETKLLFIL